MLVSDGLNHSVRRVSPHGRAATVAGNGDGLRTAWATPRASTGRKASR